MGHIDFACQGILRIASQYTESNALKGLPQSHVATGSALRPPPTVSLWTLMARASHFWERDGLSESFAKIISNHGDIVRLPAGFRKSAYLVANPYVIHEMFTDDTMFSEDRTVDARERKAFTTVFGEGHITMLADDEWTKEKRVFWKLFSKKSVHEHWDASLARAVEAFLDRTEEEISARGSTRPLEPLFHMTMQVLMEFIVPDFSADPALLLQTALAFRTLLHNFFDKKIAKDAKRAYALLDALMEEHFKHAPESKVAACEHAGGHDKLMHSIHMVLDALVSPPEMICFMLYVLSHHPEIEKKLVAEAEATAGTSQEGPEIDFTQMPYFQAVLRETLRLFPLVYMVRRTSRKGAHVGQFEFEPNSRLVFDLLGANRHPLYWPDPNIFKPERFLEGSEHPPIYSFGFGRLGCVGEFFTYHTLANILIRLLRRFRIVGPASIDTTAALVLMIKGEFEIKLEPR